MLPAASPHTAPPMRKASRLPGPEAASYPATVSGRASHAGTRPRPQPHKPLVLHAQALADKVKVTAPLADDEVASGLPVRVERIRMWQGGSPDPEDLSTSSQPTRRHQKSLVVQGTYMIQLRQLENVYLRARSLAAGTAPHAAAPASAGRVQLAHTDKQKPFRQRGKPKAGPRHRLQQHDGSLQLQEGRDNALPASTLPTASECAPLEDMEAVRRASSSTSSTSSHIPYHPRQRASGHLDGSGSRESASASLPMPNSSSSSTVVSERMQEEAPQQFGVRHILESLTSNTGSLGSILSKVLPVTANQALMALGTAERYRDVQQLVHAMMQAECTNEHTHAVAISALEQAGRFDMAMHHFEDLYRQDIDVGPVCSSMLIKLCAHRRDLPLALDIFYRLSGQSTLNRFTYNCLIHLCAVMGQMDEAVNVLRMMSSDRSPGCSPDSFTYAEIAKALVNSKRWDMLPRVCREIRRSQVNVSSETWSLLIVAAGRSSQPELAKQLYAVAAPLHSDAGHIQNALLSAVSRHVPLTEMLSMYRSMLEGGFKPDEYTFNAILTAMCKEGASLYAVEDLVGEMYRWNVKINTFTGTSLISAYKRAPEMMNSDPRMTMLLMEKVHDILSQLISQRQANSHAFGTVMSMHAQLGDAGGVERLLLRMRDAGVALDGKTCMFVANNFQDGGFHHAAQQFLQRTRTKKTPEPAAKKNSLRREW